MTKAATYAAQLAAWMRTASPTDRLDGRGMPEQPRCLIRGGTVEIAQIDDEGLLYMHAHWLDAEAWAALRAFGDEWLGTPSPATAEREFIAAGIAFLDAHDRLANCRGFGPRTVAISREASAATNRFRAASVALTATAGEGTEGRS